MADPQRAAASVLSAAEKCGVKIVIVGGAALTGLASLIGPLPGILLVDCLQASIAQALALTDYRRMIAVPGR